MLARFAAAEAEKLFEKASTSTGAGPTSSGSDDYQGGRIVAEHFLELGHTRVGVIADESHASTSVGRTPASLRPSGKYLALAAASSPCRATFRSNGLITPPYVQCRVMRSAGRPGLVGAGSASGRCA
jgi:hypothetical protein